MPFRADFKDYKKKLPGQEYTHACVFGGFNTGTNAMHKFVVDHFFVKWIGNGKLGHAGSEGKLWKHTARAEATPKDEIYTNGKMLKIILVKDPAFWLKSCQRKRYQFGKQNLKNGPLKLLGRNEVFDNIFHLWNAYCDFYMNDPFFEYDTVIFRSEDFIHHQIKVYKHLCKLLKPKKTFSRLEKGKGDGARTQSEGKKFYTLQTRRRLIHKPLEERLQSTCSFYLSKFGFYQITF